MMRVLLDTDINLDFILQRQPFFTEANEIFQRLADGDFEAYVSAITPVNVFYFARKANGISSANQIVKDLLTVVKVCAVNETVLQNALISPITDFEDAVQHESAVVENLDAIVTRNVGDYKNAALTIYTPDDFLNQI